jgi:hypothetical protein
MKAGNCEYVSLHSFLGITHDTMPITFTMMEVEVRSPQKAPKITQKRACLIILDGGLL